jgi:hypothetical protein
VVETEVVGQLRDTDRVGRRVDVAEDRVAGRISERSGLLGRLVAVDAVIGSAAARPRRHDQQEHADEQQDRSGLGMAGRSGVGPITT